ncbi:MAG: hypothetical protein FDZ70_00910 [Actinobacteria bacterium]|nr:MAG: hypothetical protein FDZ70_00910 [Actinomycetota bacterium]
MGLLKRSTHGPRGERAPSGLGLFTAVLVIRWCILVVEGVLYLRNLATGEMDMTGFPAVFAGLVAYHVVLTGSRRRVYASHMRTRLFAVVDYLVAAAALALCGGTQGWSPLYTYSWGSILMTSLHGTWPAAVAGALSMGVIQLAALAFRGAAPAVLAANGEASLVAVLTVDYAVVAVVWMYASRTAFRLRRAVEESERGREQLDRAVRELDEHTRNVLAIHRIRSAMLGRSRMADVLRVALDALSDAGFPGARVWRVEDGTAALMPPEGGTTATHAEDDALLARVTGGGETVTLVEDATFCGALVRAPAVLVPVLGEGVTGVLVVEGGESLLSEQTIELLSLFAAQIAVARQHLRLLERAGEFAVAQERNRMALELHDTVVQKLYGANLLLDAMLGSELPDALRADLVRLKAGVAGALTDLRFSVLEWDSLAWEDDLPHVVERYSDEFSALAHVPVDLTVCGRPRDVGADKRKDLLCVLQEALGNVWCHARASHVEVRLAFGEHGVTLAVADDGVGFDEGSVTHGSGAGLREMRGRGERHAGRLSVQSTPGGGAQVQVWLPC